MSDDLVTNVHHDPDNAGQLIVTQHVDMDAMHRVADLCKRLQNEGMHGQKDMRVMGHYPRAVVELYIKRNGIDFRTFMREPVHAKNIMRDPALAYFRVWNGAV